MSNPLLQPEPSRPDQRVRTAQVVAALAKHGLTLGAAESCTGGMLSSTLTEVAGVSAVFNGAIVSYADVVKRTVLGVSQEVLSTQGAVSETCAEAMAEGARACLNVDIGIAITGVAGPDGGCEDKPVGMVCFAWTGPELHRVATEYFSGDRAQVRHQAVTYALDGVWRYLSAR